MILSILLACLSPVEECHATCDDLWIECGEGYDPNDKQHVICDQCDVASERAVDDWLECHAGAVEDAEVSTYGWDDEACAAVAAECGTYPY